MVLIETNITYAKNNGSFDDDLFFFTPNKKDFLKDVHTYNYNYLSVKLTKKQFNL